MATVTDDKVGWASRARVGPGLGLALLSASCFGLSGALARGLLDAGWSAGAAVAARVAIAALVLLLPAWRQLRGRWHLVRRNAGLLLVYGMVPVAGCQLAFFSAVDHLQVSVALLIEYTAPVLVVGWLWLRHGQAPRALTLVGAVVAAAGLVLVLDVVSGADLSPVGVAWALAATVGAATYFVLSAQTGNGLPPVVLAAGALLVGAAVLLLAGTIGVVPLEVASVDASFDGRTVPWWVPVLGLGVVTAAVAYVTGIEASRRLGSRLASFVALSEVVAALVFAWVLLAEVPGPLQLAGGLLIVGGVVLVKLGEPRG